MNLERRYQDLPIFVQWMDFIKWLFLTTEKFPKKMRFNFTDRINSLALDVVEDLIEARYSTNKAGTLRRVNLNIEKIRMLLRICFEIQVLPFKAYEQSMVSLNDIGKMLGGWLKQQNEQKKHETP